MKESQERWSYVMEKRGMKVNRSKMEYMCVNESEDGKVKMEAAEVVKVGQFKYLGSSKPR